MANLEELFEKHTDVEYLEFKHVAHKHSNRRDVHAFMLLDKLQPGTKDIVAAAEHDEIWLGIDCEKLELTEDQVIELLRCGVRFDSDTESLAMFV